MNNPQTEYVVIGKIGAAYGIKGWLKIVSFTESITNILDYAPWYLQEGQTWKPVKVDGGREHGKGIVVHIAGFDTPESARLLTGKVIGIQRSQLPALKKQEYYWSDLEGLTVINQRGETLGKVIYLMATGSNDVLVIKGEKEHAIPYLPGDTITSIDLEKGEMHVDWDLI
ncbi:MAG: ribosome maturation factor RimM [Gammaproteobacteria bacterium]|nr:ribosome maturation factor RimM [Gammaproteobacteria bacterium]